MKLYRYCAPCQNAKHGECVISETSPCDCTHVLRTSRAEMNILRTLRHMHDNAESIERWFELIDKKEFPEKSFHVMYSIFLQRDIRTFYGSLRSDLERRAKQNADDLQPK